jgi:hypothetical protein
MDYCLGGESPAVLQLHKWGPSQFNIDLSEFREGFISPTRELLLLLSYQCEALLLPLVAGKYTSKNPYVSVFCYGMLWLWFSLHIGLLLFCNHFGRGIGK